MDIGDLQRIAEESYDRFRLEGLPQYLVDQEADEFAAWRRGERTQRDVDANPWLRHIRDTTAVGVQWSRVRIVDHPLSEYTAFELHGLQGNAAAGEGVYVADRAWSPDLTDIADFWLFDHTTAVRMIYDDEGRFIRPELDEDVDRYLDLRTAVQRHSILLADFLAAQEPRLIA